MAVDLSISTGKIYISKAEISLHITALINNEIYIYISHLIHCGWYIQPNPKKEKKKEKETPQK